VRNSTEVVNLDTKVKKARQSTSAVNARSLGIDGVGMMPTPRTPPLRRWEGIITSYAD
jgi:hypothetical protein